MDPTNTTQYVSNNVQPQPPFSYRTFVILEAGIFLVAICTFATFGVFSNTINIVVFYRQGILSSSTNVNLTGLAVSDFFTCLTVLICRLLAGVMHFAENGDRRSMAATLRTVFGQLPDICIQITCWITAVTTFERVISVIFPFKVKQIFSPYRSLVFILNLFIVLFFLNIQPYLSFYVVWRIHPVTNASYLGLIPSRLYNPELLKLHVGFVSSGLRFVAIIAVVVCNVVLIWQLALSQKFRRTASAGRAMPSKTSGPHPPTRTRANDENTENKHTTGYDSNVEIDKATAKPTLTKETKLLRMITLVASVFTVCNAWEIPANVLLNFVFKPMVDFHLFILDMAFGVAMLTAVVNASTNIIIYYEMSSRYKETFNELFNVK